MSQADKRKRQEECQAALEASEQEIVRLTQELQRAKQRQKERQSELRRLNPRPFEADSKLPPWQKHCTRDGQARMSQYKWQQILTEEDRKGYWEQWQQCQREGQNYDSTEYDKRLHAAYNKTLTDKLQHLHAFLGNPTFDTFDFHGDHCRLFVERAVCERFPDLETSLYDWLMQRGHPEIMKILTTYVAADDKASDFQEAQYNAFYHRALDMHE